MAERGKRQSGGEWKSRLLENGSYKLVALFVTLILWVTILGRRDFSLSKEMDLEYILPREVALAPADGAKEVPRRVLVKVSGARMALRRFAQSSGAITVDFGKNSLGPAQAFIKTSSIEVPFGIKVLSVAPNLLSVTLVPVTVSAVSDGPDGKQLNKEIAKDGGKKTEAYGDVNKSVPRSALGRVSGGSKIESQIDAQSLQREMPESGDEAKEEE